MRLFHSTTITKKENAIFSEEHNDTYNTWSGALIHTAGMSKIDLVYFIIRLCCYNTCPTAAIFKALYHLMKCLYRHLHVLIINKLG